MAHAMGAGKTAQVALILAFLSGFVDTAAFIHMQGLFVAHVTGNFVLLGAAAVAGGGAAMLGKGPQLLQLAALPVFFVAAMLTGGVSMRLSPERALTAILWSAALAMIAVGAAGALPGARMWDQASAVVLIAAMGILNAAHRMNAGMGPPFAVMTGNVAALAIHAGVLLRLAPRPPEASGGSGAGGAGEAKMLRAVIGFAAGCGAGALAQAWIGLAAVALPASVLALRLAWRG